MRIHLLSKNTVEKYINKNKQSEVPLKKWLESLKNADWDIPQDILSSFNSADLLGRKDEY